MYGMCVCVCVLTFMLLIRWVVDSHSDEDEEDEERPDDLNQKLKLSEGKKHSNVSIFFRVLSVEDIRLCPMRTRRLLIELSEMKSIPLTALTTHTHTTPVSLYLFLIPITISVF